METIMKENADYMAAVNGIISVVNVAMPVIEAMYEAMNLEVDTSNLEEAESAIDQMVDKTQELNCVMEIAQSMEFPELDFPVGKTINVEAQPLVMDISSDDLSSIEMEVQPNAPPEPVNVPVLWETGTLDIFTGKGSGKFKKEAKSIKTIMEDLYERQEDIADLLPLEMFQGAGEITNAIEELGQIQFMIHQTLQRQNDWNTAIGNMNLSLINKAYFQLAQAISNIGSNIRDNAGEQAKMNVLSQQSVRSTITQNSVLLEMFDSLVAQLIKNKTILAIVKRVGNESIKLVMKSAGVFEGVMSTSRQLMSALANQLEDEYVINYMIQSSIIADSPVSMEPNGSIQRSNGNMGVTVETRANALQEGFDSIIEKASAIQSNGVYKAEVMIAGATELTNYFNDPRAIEMMLEPLANYAMKMNGLGEVDVKGMVAYAADIGNLRNQKTSALPGINAGMTESQQAIIGGTATDEQIIASLGQEYLNLSEDMRAAAVIAQVLQNTCGGFYENMSGLPQGRIIQFNNELNHMQEIIGEKLYPSIVAFTDALMNNMGGAYAILNVFLDVIRGICSIFSFLTELVLSVASVILENWSMIAPIIYGIVAALIILCLWQIKIAVANALTAISAWLAAHATQMHVVAIMLIIALSYSLLQAFAEAIGLANSGLGLITGVLNVVIQLLINLVLLLCNVFYGIKNAAEALGTNMEIAITNSIASIKSTFYSLLSTVLTVVASICEALNKLPFVEFDYSGITEAADKFAQKAAEEKEEKKEFVSVKEAFESGFNTYEVFQEGWLSKAYNDGAEWGDNIAEKIANFDLGSFFGVEKPEGIDDIYALDYLGDNQNDGINDNLDNIATDTGAISDSMDVTQEDLKYLRDIAEQESINKYTLAEVKIEQTNHNNVSSGMDLDGVVSGLTDAVNEAVDIVTEGVHA